MGVMERYEENKKKKQQNTSNTVSLGVQERYELNKAVGNKNYEVNEEFIKSFVSDANSFLDSAEKEYSNLGWGTASSVYDSKNSTWLDLYSKSTAVRRWLDNNKNNLDADSYKNLSESIDSITNGIYSVTNSFKSAKNYYAQWDNEDDYNEYARQQKEREDLLNSEDFEHYSQIGASIKNPSHEEAEPYLSIFGWDFGEQIPGNIVTYSRDNAEALGVSEANGGGSKVGGRYIYSFLTDEEVAVYNYYLGKGDKAKADEFLASMEDILQRRHAGKMVENIGDSRGLQMVMAVAAGLDQFSSGIKNIDNYFKGTEGDTVNAVQYASSTIRQDLDGGWGVAYDFINTTSNMLPSVLVSYVPVVGQAAGLATMGTSAVGNAYAEMRNLGYDANQARGYATLVGASEVALQKLLGGISSLGGVSKHVAKFVNKFDNALARLALNYGINSASEGLEEGIQTAIEPVFKAWATGEDLEAAKWDDIMYSALLGSLSAGFIEGVPTSIGAAGIISSNIDAKKTYGSGADVVTEAIDVGGDAKALGEKYQKRLDGGKELSGGQINRLLEEIDTAVRSNDTAKIKNAILKTLGEYGETTDVTPIADVLVKYATGEKLTSRDYSILNNSDKGHLILAELNKENIKSGGLSNNWASNIGTKRISLDAYNKDFFERAKAFFEGRENAEKEAVAKTIADAENAKGEKFDSSDSGKIIYKDAQGNSREVSVNKVVSTEGGLKVELDDGNTVSAKDLTFGSHAEAIVYEMVTRMDVSPETATDFIKSFKPTNDKQAAVYFSEVPLAYKYGTINYEAGLKNVKMPESEKRIAFNRGKADAIAKAKQNTKTAPKSAQTAKTENSDKTGKNGIVYEDGFAYDEASANEMQKVSMAHIEVIDQISNLEVHIYESKVVDGKRVAYVNGKRVSAPNGYFKDGNKIYIDFASGNNGEGAMLYTMSHEITHFIRKWNEKGFKELADFLIGQYGKKGVPVNSLIEAQKETIKKRYKEEDKTLPSDAKLFDMAYEELVADAMSDMLTDPKAYEKLMKLKQKNHSLWVKLGEAIKAILDKFKSALGIYKTKDVAVAQEAHEVRGFTAEAYEKLQDLYIKAFVDADANYEASRNDGSTDLDGDENAHVFSERSMVEGAGLQFVLNEDGVNYKVLDKDGKPVKSVTKEMIVDSPLGNLVTMAKNEGFLGKGKEATLAANKQYEFLAELVNMCINYNGIAPIWETAGTMVFSSMKSNADKQYGLTIDFSTVCKKTQAIVDAMSEAMLRLGRGLTRSEVEAIYLEVGKAGESTPCPVCYVFSRWMGIGGILDQISRFQDKYTNMSEKSLQAFIADIKKRIVERANTPGKNGKLKDAFFNKKGEISEGQVITDLKSKASSKAASALNAIAKNSDAQLQIQELEALMENQDSKEAKKTAKKIESLKKKLTDVEALEKEMRDADDILEEYEAYQWLTRTLMTESNGEWVKNSAFKPVPKDILFDLNKGDKFAEGYPLSWAFRTGKGASAGKAIVPYADARVGEAIQTVASGSPKDIKIGLELNPFLNSDTKGRLKILKSAIEKQARQNLIGGQRYQSTSDFRYEYGSDYLITFLEMQAIGAKVQLYTKVIEAVDFLASMGADCNLSVMPLSDGFITLPDGTKKLVYSSVTGIDADAAIKKSHEYNNVQLILVGISDEHIRLALEGTDVTFVIPFHGSGNSVHQIQALMNLLGENLDVTTAQDYTPVQNDHVSPNRTKEQKAMWDLRVKIIQGKASKITASEQALLDKNAFLKDLYRRFYIDQTADEYGVGLTAGQSEQIFPYEYWDKSFTYAEADRNGDRFKEYCASMGIIPRFSGKDSKGENVGFGDFSNDKGYWKLLIDRPMYDNTYDADGNWTGYGKYHEQARINCSNFQVKHLDPEYGSATYGEVMSKANDPKKTNKIVDAALKQFENNEINDVRSETLLSDRDSVISDVVSNIESDQIDFDQNEVIEHTTDVVNSIMFSDRGDVTNTENTYMKIGKEMMAYAEGDRKPDLTLVEVYNERTGKTETTIKFVGDKPKDYIPQKIAYCYKLFEQHPDGTLHALFAGASNATPVGEWVYSKGFPYTDSGVKGMNLRERYGWHLSAGLPSAPHLMSSKEFERGYPSKNAYGHPKGSKRVWVRMAYDATTDFNSIADSTTTGDIFGLIPFGGYYAFKENNQSEWVISSAVKIDKILKEEERQQILKDAGYDEYEAWRKKHRATEAEKAESKRKSAENKKAKDNAKKAGLNYLSESAKEMREAINSRIIDNPELSDIRYSDRDSATVASDLVSHMRGIIQSKNSWSIEDLFDYVEKHQEVDFVERIFNKDKTVKSDLEAFLNGIDDAKLLHDFSWFIGEAYARKGLRYNDSYRLYSPYQGAVRTFRNAIKKRTTEVMSQVTGGKNLGVKNGNVSLDDIKDLFDRLNSDAEIGSLAKKVFATAEKLGVNIRFANDVMSKNKKVGGDNLGDMVEYKTSYFNDAAYSDQRKAQTILHELIHACTVYVLEENPYMGDVGFSGLKSDNYERIANAATRLNRIYYEIKNDPDFQGMYGIKNAKEMVAELSNPKFVEALKKKSLWQQVLDFICELFGFTRGNSAYDNAMMCLDYILDNPEISEYKKYSTEQRWNARRNGYNVFGQTIGTDGVVRYSDRTSYAPTFYSHMGKVIDEIRLEKMGAGGVVSYLKGKGVKDEEIKWSGIEAFLGGKKSVTKAELQEFIAGSQLVIEEEITEEDKYEDRIVLWQSPQANVKVLYIDGKAEDIFRRNEYGHWVSDELGDIFFDEQDILDKVRSDYGQNVAKTNNTKWSKYKLDGGTNYRELVFKLPNSSYTNQAMQAHWGNDAEGVLAHARIQDMTTSEGKKMLFIEEIQSDWHNEGAKDGYADSKNEALLDSLESKASEAFLKVEDYSTEMTGLAGEWETIEKTEKGAKLLREYREAQASYMNAMGESFKKIPDAPFRTNYHEYVLKRLLRMAAEEGYDSIGWTTADIQSKRWSDEYAEGYRIEYDQDIPKFLRKYGKKWGATVNQTTLEGDSEGVTTYVIGSEEGGDGQHYETVDEAVEALIENTNDMWGTEFSVENADVNELGDSIIVSDQDTGDEIGTIHADYSTEGRDDVDVWSMDITDSMRDSVLYEGQVLYSDRNVGSTIYIKDGHTADGETVNFIDLILDGKKKGETRTHKSLTRKWVGIAKDGHVYGLVRFGNPYLISKDSPEYKDSFIEGTEYDLKGNEKKYYYPILETEDFRDEPKPIVKNGNYGTFLYSDRNYSEGLSEADKEVADNVIRRLKEKKMFGKYYIGYGTYTEKRINDEIAWSMAQNDPDYAQTYITWVKPSDYIYATTATEAWREQLAKEAGTLDKERLAKETQPIYLTVDFETGKIKGHEGRHRMIALEKAGVEKVAVIIISRHDQYWQTKPIEVMKLEGQDFGDYKRGAGFFLHDMLPLSERYADVAREMFSFDTTDGVRFSDRNPNAVSNRTILANALESVAQNDVEKNKLAQYKAKIALIESEQAKLNEIKEKANEIRFTKGRTPSETKTMRDLEFEANQIANRINTYDKQLLNLESTTALKNVLEREKKLLRKRLEQKGKDAIKAQKEKDAKTIRALMDRHTESRKKAIEGRHKTEMRDKIKKVVSDLNHMLLHPTKEQHVPIGLQLPVAEALDAINMDTMNAGERVSYYNNLIAKSNNPDEIAMLTKKRDFFEYRDANFKERITALKNAYAEFKSSDDPLIRNAHNEAIEDLIKNTADAVGNKSLKDMSFEQLESVYRMYKAILATVRNSNKMFKEGRQATVTDNSEAVKTEVREVGGHKDRVLKITKFLKKFGWGMLKPVTAMKVVGSNTFSKLFANVRAGEDTWAVDVSEAKQFYEDVSSKHGFKKWDFKELHDFKDSTGTKFSLSLEQIMSLYAYSKRDQADRHLEVGGFVFDDAIEVIEKGKFGVPIKYEVNDANPYRLRKEDLASVIEALTHEQKAFVDAMQTYLSDVMGAKGNEVSLALYDIKLYNETNYFPLKTSSHFREVDLEKSGSPKIKNSGFSKKTVPQAGNPIVLSNFTEVWAKHVNDMSLYHAFVLPLEDFWRVYNYSSTAGGYDSVKQCITNAYGSQAVEYIERLIDDLNGGARVDSSAGIINKGLSLFKKASTFASASVVIQQPSAIARALAYISPKYFLASTPSALNVAKHKAVWAEIKKYAPVAIIKEMGYFDTGVGRSTVDWIKGNQTIKDKVDDFLSKAPAMADELCWAHIWEAVKRETKATTNLKVGSEEFLKKCGERFTEVITNTQVYDSVLSRSGMMRSKDTGMKMATAFMAEPTTTVNMMVDGIIQGKRGNKKFTAATLGAVSSSIILNSLLVSIVYAARDDDEDETYTEKYLASLTTELLDGFNPVTYIPFLKDAWSILQGFDVERADMTIVTNLIDSLQQFTKVLAKDTEDMDEEELEAYRKEVNEAVLSIIDNATSIVGVPVKNIRRDIEAVINTVKTIARGDKTTANSLADAMSEAAQNSIPVWGWLPDEKKTDKLYEAIMSGDDAYVDRLKKSYKDEDAYKSAVRKALQENDPRIHEAAQARYNGDIATYTRIAKEIIAEGNFSQDIVVGAINAEMSAIKNGESSGTKPTEDKDEATSIYSASDVNAAFNNGDNDTALKIIDDLVNTKVANGKTEKEAKSSVRSSMTSYWKPLYKEAYQSGDTNEMARIRKILFSSGLYGTANDVVKTAQDWLKD